MPSSTRPEPRTHVYLSRVDRSLADRDCSGGDRGRRRRARHLRIQDCDAQCAVRKFRLGTVAGGEAMSTWNQVATHMLAHDGPAALVCRQWLIPAEGREAVIFPPTFAAAEGGKSGYN